MTQFLSAFIRVHLWFQFPVLLQYEDILLRAHLLEDFGPHRDRHLAEVGLAQQRARLSDAAANAQRQVTVDDP